MVVLMMLNVIISAPVTAIGGIIMALRLDVPLSGLILVVVPVMGVFIGLVVRKAVPLFRAMQVKIDRINQVTRETLSGVRVIRAFVRTGYEERRFDEANADLTQTALRVTRMFALMIPMLMLILNLSTVAIMWFGSNQVANRGMPIGNLTAFLTYVMQILLSVMMATIMFVMVPRAAASADRIQQVLETEPTITDPESPAADVPARGVVEFEDVEFRYPGAEEPVLSDITFTAQPGETTAIVGSTGSGKSTLINLIPRFYDVTGGTRPRRRRRRARDGAAGPVAQDRARAAEVVPVQRHRGQQPALRQRRTPPTTSCGACSASRRAASSSPRCPSSSRRRSPRAAPTCRAGSASAWPSPARWSSAPASSSSTTASRPSTSRPTRCCARALKRETADATVLIVAQRVGTIMHADRIIVLEDGTIAGIGTHEELLQTSETYREIVASQLGEEHASVSTPRPAGAARAARPRPGGPPRGARCARAAARPATP